MTLTRDEVMNAGPLGNAWAALRAAEGDLHKIVPICSDEMHLIACLWSHLEDIDTAIEEAVRGNAGGNVGDGVDERADTPQTNANRWPMTPCYACPEDGSEDEDCDEDGEELEPSGFSMDDEGD